MVAKKIVNDVLALPPDERWELAEKLWESLRDTAQSMPLSDEQKAMLDERLLDMEQRPDDGTSWEQVKADLRKTR
jgi:putative addiction module component (TIGR02574 family)